MGRLELILPATLVLIALLVACAQQPATDLQPAKDTPAPVGGTPGPDVVEAKTDLTPNPAVIKLLENNGQVKSYWFAVADLPDERGGPFYSVMGSKARVEPTIEQVTTLGVDVVFLDLDAKTATGYCIIGKSKCPDPNKQIPLSFDDWVVPLPPSYIEDLKYGEVIGSSTFLKRQVTHVKYHKGDLYYEAYLENYYGYPLRVAISDSQDMSNVIGGYEYRSMAFNSIKDTDVVHQEVK
jgi:hypothetical protein